MGVDEQHETTTPELESAREQIACLKAAIEELKEDNERLRHETSDQRVPGNQADLLRWRREALASWADSLTATERLRELESKYREVGHAAHLRALEIDRLDTELKAIRTTVSWRVTAPLRKLRRSAS